MTEITATLKNATRHTWGSHVVITGNIFGDTRKRFDDGSVVTTSSVQEEKGDLIFTRNSIYKVEWAPKNPEFAG